MAASPSQRKRRNCTSCTSITLPPGDQVLEDSRNPELVKVIGKEVMKKWKGEAKVELDQVLADSRNPELQKVIGKEKLKKWKDEAKEV